MALLGPCAPLLAAQPPTERAPDTMQARVLGCAACHGEHGEGTDNDYFPRLAGKPAGYLYNQLIAFRDGGRSYPPMNYLLAYLPDDYLKSVAEHFAQERPPYPAPAQPKVDAATLALGEQLVKHGAPDRKIPACAACHGDTLTGMRPAIPGLVGLHADYISAQLGAFRFGTRRTASPNCMHDITSHLADREITAISAWLAAQPAPADPTPAAPSHLPLECGSVPN
ncbi:c-type cytochrome [Paraburkholderia sp.]|uniref:c-type cytochrome n=1 Tax=Paraburkholderia sp. TaxID=1926495 RepID=UPI0025DCD048|nr:c-type cytochrome [Paraburkholderia sp.]